MSRSVGRAVAVFVTTVRAVWFQGQSCTDRSRSISLPKATFLFAAHNRLAMLSSICEHLIDSISEGAPFTQLACRFLGLSRSAGMDIGSQVEDQGGAYETEADERGDECE